MPRYLRLYGTYLRQNALIWMQYRVSFLVGMLSTVAMQLGGLLTIWVVMRQIPAIHGWTFNQVLLVYGLTTLAQSLSSMVALNLWNLGWNYILTGDFDRLLTRPVNPLFSVVADSLSYDGVTTFLVGLALVIHATVALGIALSPMKLAFLVITVISGGCIFIGINLFTSASSFWLGQGLPVMQAVFELNQFARYPLSIYNRGIMIFLTWLVPYGLASYYPAEYLLDRGIGAAAWLTPLAAILILALGYRFWMFAMRHYTSTGS